MLPGMKLFLLSVTCSIRTESREILHIDLLCSAVTVQCLLTLGRWRILLSEDGPSILGSLSLIDLLIHAKIWNYRHRSDSDFWGRLKPSSKELQTTTLAVSNLESNEARQMKVIKCSVQDFCSSFSP